MLKSAAPSPYTIPFANSGAYNVIPVASQIGITNGAASFTDGFPPLTRTPIASGGVPPFGLDMNGILNSATLALQWAQVGFRYAFSSTLSTAIGGYPAGAQLLRADGRGGWLNLTDSNTTNPDTTGSSGWVALRANAGISTIALTGASVTPDPSVLGAPLLVLTGTLTANCTLFLPLTNAGARWTVYNSTTGAFTVNVQGATGTGVTATQGSLTEVITDGTNFYTTTLTGAYLPIGGTAVAATKLATARSISMTGPVTWTIPAFDGSANVTAAATIAAGAVTLANLANLTGNTLLGNPTGTAAAPSAITLLNGIVFSGGTSLGLGGITPTSVTTAGVIAANLANAGGVQISQGTAASSSIYLTNTISGGHSWEVASAGGAIATVGWFYIRDITAGVTQMTIDNSGNATHTGSVTSGGTITASTNFASSTGSAVLAATGAGTVYLRPNGAGSATGQCYVTPAGVLSVANNVNCQQVQLSAQAAFQFSFTGGPTYFWGQGGSGDNVLNFNRLGTANYATTFFGSVTATTLNASSSDERLKTAINRAAAPRDLVGVAPWATWEWDYNDLKGTKGAGPIAQDMQQIAPEYIVTSTIPVKSADGTETQFERLGYDKGAAALEQAYFNRREIDRLWARLREILPEMS